MNGKHEFGCDCRDCMTYLGTHIDEWMPEDASSTALRTRDFEPRLINNVESLVDHATESQEISGKHGISCDCPACMTYMGTSICVDIDQWMSDDASFPVFGSRDAEQRLGNNVQSWVDQKINQEGLDAVQRREFQKCSLGPLDLFSDPPNSGHYFPYAVQRRDFQKLGRTHHRTSIALCQHI